MTERLISKPMKKAKIKQSFGEGAIVRNEGDLENLYKLWPSDADPDDLLEFIMSERKERRKNPKQKRV
jgi:hypothetical protein